LTPTTDTLYDNVPPAATPPDNVNNGNTESLGVAIADNGNMLIGWEDDGEGLLDLEAVWTMYDATGAAITPDRLITSQDTVNGYAGQTINSRFLSYFRGDGSAVSGRTSWGPKIKANLFGTGVGMGATSFDLGLEMTEMAGFTGNGDWPTVQLLTSSGAPLANPSVLNGVPEAYAADADQKDIRIGDWDYLSNGNVVIVGESRQEAELVSKYGGAAPGRHVIYRIVDKNGNEIKAVSLVSDKPVPGEMWHGVGVTKGGFAVRWASEGRATVRMFLNDGTPTTTNLDLGTLTGHEIAAGGGRGDSAGFHGNGLANYVAVNAGTVDGTNQVWVTVLSTNGTVVFSRAVCDDYAINKAGRVDAAIAGNGRVFAVWSATIVDDPAPELVMGRVLDATGNPVGGTFYLSEQDSETTAAYYTSVEPRVTVRGSAFAAVWVSNNNPTSSGTPIVAARLFGVTFVPKSIEEQGMTRLVPDTVINPPDYDKLGNWEPYSSVLGNSVFLIESNGYATNTNDKQEWFVQLQPADGSKPPKLMTMFYTDAGQPYYDPINTSRQNGNPGRVAGDKRPGATNFIVGAEATPEAYPDFFNSDGRFDATKAFWAWTLEKNNRHGCVQTHSLDVATLTPTVRSKMQDSAFGRTYVDTTPPDTADSGQISRFGGELCGLDNGNFVSVVEDRSRLLRADGNCGTATIFAPDGTVVKEAFKIADGDIWSNACSYKGGWAARMNGIIYFYDNDGNLKGQIDQATSGRSFDRGRGDGTRIQGHINSPYVFLTGTTGGKLVSLACFDSRDASFVAVQDVSETGFPGSADRVGLAVDALNRVVVAWTSQPADYEQQQVAARVMAFDEGTKAITPLTDSFLPFINAAKTGGIRSLQMNPAITTKEIMIAAKGEINMQNKPELGANSFSEVNFYTVFTHKAPAEDPTTPVGGEVTKPTLTIAKSGNNVTISWTPTAAGFTLQSTPSLTPPVTWTDVGTQNPATVAIGAGAKYFRVKK